MDGYVNIAGDEVRFDWAGPRNPGYIVMSFTPDGSESYIIVDNSRLKNAIFIYIINADSRISWVNGISTILCTDKMFLGILCGAGERHPGAIGKTWMAECTIIG